MKVILVVVASLDGKTTKWDFPGVDDLSSKEDQEYFYETLNKNKLIIMGRKTFELAKPDIYKGSKKLRVVITKNPKKYKKLEVEDRLKFTNKQPKQILAELEKQNYKQALLVGGSEINTLFFRDKLVDEIWLTIEHYFLVTTFFTEGNDLTTGQNFDIELKLKSSKRLNATGTLLLKYEVL